MERLNLHLFWGICLYYVILKIINFPSQKNAHYCSNLPKRKKIKWLKYKKYISKYYLNVLILSVSWWESQDEIVKLGSVLTLELKPCTKSRFSLQGHLLTLNIGFYMLLGLEGRQNPEHVSCKTWPMNGYP